MTVLVLGGRGYVGQNFTRFFREQKLTSQSLSRAELDYTDRDTLRGYLQKNRPDFLINAAGFTGKPNVDACESAKADTLFGNTVLPLRIAQVCRELEIPWGHVSSGCIYQGVKSLDAQGQPIGFKEEDMPNFSFQSGNCSFYSGTKAMAETYLMQEAPNAYSWRLRVPFHQDDGPRNYLSKLLRYERLLNVRNSLSHLNDFVASCWATMERSLPYGIYNLTNPGSITAREVTELMWEEGERRKAAGDAFSAEQFLKTFAYFDSEAEFMRLGTHAPRSNCVLDTAKAERLGLPLRPVREALQDSLARWVWETSR